jgi:RNA polymerase sigma factor (sigma-70 family)
VVSPQGYERASDRELLRRFVEQRDEGAFAALVRRHSAMVLGVARRVLHQQQDAEDVCQATFLVLAQKAGRTAWRDSVANWLYEVAGRLARKARDAARRRSAREGKAPVRVPPDALAEVSLRDLQTALDEELKRLPAKYRAPILLCCLEGKARDEAAQCLGWPLATVKARLEEGRELLRRRLARRGLALSAVLAGVTLPAGASLSAAPVRALTRAALQALAGQKAKSGLATALLLAVAALGLGAGALAAHVLAAPQQAPTPPASQAALEGRQAPQPGPTAPDGKPAEEMEVQGRVLGPDGKPVAGARLFLPRLTRAEPVSHRDAVARLVGTTDADGRFRLTFRRPAGDMRNYFPDHDLRHDLIAHADGLGVDWVNLSEVKQPGDVTFRLPKDVPITGRVVNTEGGPVAGVSVSAGTIFVPADEKLDDYLAGWLRNWREVLATPRKRLHVPLDGITGAVTTDKDGRFTLRGCGAERVVHVTFSGAGVAHTTPYVITRPGLDPKPYNAVLLKEEYRSLRQLNRFLGLYPPALTFVAEMGKTAEGVVKDAATGKPLPGCRVSAYVGLGGVFVGTVSDAGGKYRLDGLPKNARGYLVSVRPPKGSAYLSRSADAADTDGLRKVTIDVELVKGAVVTGRVVDRQTGKGVWGSVRLVPLADNKFVGHRSGFNAGSGAATDKESGRFRLVALPGKALLTVQAHEGEKFQGEYLSPYRRAVPDPDHKEIFRYDDNEGSWYVETLNGYEFNHVLHAARVIDVKESGETTADLVVDRGVTAKVAVQDGEGKPLAGAWAARLTDHWPITYKLPEPTATVYALSSDKPRTMAFFHPEKRLGGTAVVRGDEKGPVVVKLAPVGSVSGRLREEDGTPLAGAEVSVNARGRVARALYRFARPTGKLVRTDKDGRFRLEGVVPGVAFHLQVSKEGVGFVGPLQLKPGEGRDLGNRTVKLRR